MFWFLRKILGFVAETATISSRTMVFSLLTNTFASFNASYSLSILDHCSCFDSPVSGVKISQSKFLICTPLHHGFQILIVGNRYLLMNLHVVQFQYGFELSGLTYSQICTDFPRYYRRESLTQTIKLRPILYRFPGCCHHEE